MEKFQRTVQVVKVGFSRFPFQNAPLSKVFLVTENIQKGLPMVSDYPGPGGGNAPALKAGFQF